MHLATTTAKGHFCEFLISNILVTSLSSDLFDGLSFLYCFRGIRFVFFKIYMIGRFESLRPAQFILLSEPWVLPVHWYHLFV